MIPTGILQKKRQTLENTAVCLFLVSFSGTPLPENPSEGSRRNGFKNKIAHRNAFAGGCHEIDTSQKDGLVCKKGNPTALAVGDTYYIVKSLFCKYSIVTKNERKFCEKTYGVKKKTESGSFFVAFFNRQRMSYSRFSMKKGRKTSRFRRRFYFFLKKGRKSSFQKSFYLL